MLPGFSPRVREGSDDSSFSLFFATPLFGVVLAVFMGLTFFPVDLTLPIVSVDLMSHAHLSMDGNDFFLAAAILFLFVELVRAANATHRYIVVKHIMSTLVFVAFVVLFIVHEDCGNATFLHLGLLSLVNVLAGWTITHRGALRDLSVS